jgi:hypothetical protein
MAIVDIPNAVEVGQSPLKGFEQVNNMFAKMREAQLQKQQNEQTDKYHMGLLDIQKQELPTQNALRQAQAEYYKSGGRGAGGGVGLKDQLSLMQQAMRDNPGIDMEKANEITNAWLDGKATLDDGTPVPPPKGNARLTVDRLNKGRTTAALMNQGVQANQAAAEMPIYDKAINEAVQPYGTTVFGQSAQQIKDFAHPGDEKAQTRLGKYLGAQVLLYDRAALNLKINGLPAGVTIADEIKKLSNQTINAKFPMMTADARKIASDYVAKTLESGLNARKKVPITASSLMNQGEGQDNQSNVKKWKIENGSLVEG